MKSTKRGFSFIEVVLVLGIAGLIFMMAFIALPSLWASQRDAERRAMVMEFISDLKTYQTNNSRGALPVLPATGAAMFDLSAARAYATNDSSWQRFVKDYVSADFGGPDENELAFHVHNCSALNGGGLENYKPCADDAQAASANADGGPSSTANDIKNRLFVFIGAVCNGDQAVKSANGRDVAAVYILERSGRYCYNT